MTTSDTTTPLFQKTDNKNANIFNVAMTFSIISTTSMDTSSSKNDSSASFSNPWYDGTFYPDCDVNDSLDCEDTGAASLCLMCDQEGTKQCGSCHEARYCSPSCQTGDWAYTTKRVCPVAGDGYLNARRLAMEPQDFRAHDFRSVVNFLHAKIPKQCVVDPERFVLCRDCEMVPAVKVNCDGDVARFRHSCPRASRSCRASSPSWFLPACRPSCSSACRGLRCSACRGMSAWRTATRT
ncbi:hypothetical protein BKA67DRAFT_133615 [Truncatella angustata]|uniref:MYND-type domain-containing protein n=1 Tax=Truncatella angustata TaxID=152316 RepID=A0A9P8RKE5_9PEZI|nr:uncharacterized protein BKA67DRAFT_133615 [Truncatella angustata]KAH6643370.1 hypothetical protein BKA67DRAFT_133615 [Truncatella angustata]